MGRGNVCVKIKYVLKMESIKMFSYNVRGLGNQLKRRKIFRSFKSKKTDIVLLQEVHCAEKINNLFNSEWGNKCLFANGDSNARGVAICFSKK